MRLFRGNFIVADDFPKNKPCKCNNQQNFADTKIAVKESNVEERLCAGCNTLKSGTMQKNIHPKDDVLHVEVKTESGRISIEINDADGNVIFDEIDIGTASFNVDVFGKVTVKIVADSHKGSFAVTSEN